MVANVELKEVDTLELMWRCEEPGGIAKLRRESKPYHARLVALCKGQLGNLMALRDFTARIVAFSFVRGARFGYELKDRQLVSTVVREILKSVAVRKLLMKTPRVSTLEICSALDDRGIRLPWPELRKQGECWATCATKSKVKMAISHARKAAIDLTEDERWLRVVNTTQAEFRLAGNKRRDRWTG